MSMEFKAWTDINRIRSEMGLDLDLDIMSDFDGFDNISYQCLNQEEIEREEQDVKDTLTADKNVPKKNGFSPMSRERAFGDEKKRDQFE